MMEDKKVKNVYVCVKCGRESEHHRNTCPGCGSTMVPRTKVEKEKVIKGIVRHYHIPNSDHTPYTGVLKDEDDKDLPDVITLQRLLDDFPDGEAVTITIEGHGLHKNAKGHIWILTSPHVYERQKVESKDA